MKITINFGEQNCAAFFTLKYNYLNHNHYQSVFRLSLKILKYLHVKPLLTRFQTFSCQRLRAITIASLPEKKRVESLPPYFLCRQRSERTEVFKLFNVSAQGYLKSRRHMLDCLNPFKMKSRLSQQKVRQELFQNSQVTSN